MAGTNGNEAYDTLHAIRQADKFNGWMFEAVRPFISGKVLEAGSGIGNISSFLLPAFDEVWLSDYNPDYRRLLSNKFSSSTHLQGILPIDLADEKFDVTCAPFFNRFDTIVATNVIEHIQDDALAIGNCCKLLKPHGRLVVLVPAYQVLYNSLDRAFGHYRRYTRKGLVTELEKRMNVAYSRYFNVAGIPGWFFTGALLRKNTIPAAEMKLFNSLVPVFKVVDWLTVRQLGLSVIAIAEKRNGD